MEVSSAVVGTAATVVASVLAVNIIGAIAAHYPKHPSGRVGPSGVVPQTAIASLANVATTIFVPCLTFYSLGSRLSAEVFQEAWPLIFWAPFNILASVALGYCAIQVACVPRHFRKEFLIGCGFANILAVPLIMLEVLCDQEQLAEEDECFERGATFIFMYVFGWSLCFWTVGVAIIRGLEGGEGHGVGISWRQALSGLVNPPMLGCLFGAVVGLVAPLRRVIFDDGAPLLFISSAASAYGSSVVGMLTIVMAATLGKSLSSLNPLTWFKSTPAAPKTGATHAAAAAAAVGEEERDGTQEALGESAESLQWLEAILTPNPSKSSMYVLAESNGSEAAQQQAKQREDAVVVDIDEAIAAVRAQQHREQQQVDKQQQVQQSKGLPASAAGGTTAVGDGDGDEDEEAATKRWDVRTLVAFVVVSMFVGPAIKFGIVLLLGESVFTGANASLLQLVLSIQCVTPTANLVVVVNQREGNRRVAERLSRGVVMQYVAAIVTLLVVTTLSISSFYGDTEAAPTANATTTAATP
ncbi:hypothetical protein PTSG_01096 [Salpingoeca rosetta]|uniref:Uncharacterized protein n=1 Tax=Salpingoeca rosetta (strain ATCC 50818 / BSB-021) TaxID=946362 RepID=F2U0T1_SALR5|nr:uncharacterized protein PTSG_01096 [Salpingoeca rosetta]EGD80505.1 hypothetical protein PTSG_01096 [Salpingoeca rosetta]|eukprot:XP_004997066.1 hypothetical protein PTSG_01096 [Salpingoeca rosetta]